MRIVICIFFLFGSVLCTAQSCLEKRINVSYTNVSVEDALKDIEIKTACVFTYSPELIPVHRYISLEMAGTRVGDVLKRIFKNEVAFTVIEGHVAIYPRTTETPVRQYTLSGYVKDSLTGEILIGAFVRAEHRNIGGTTNEYGFYSITVEKGNITLVCSHIGYGSKKTSLQVNSDLRMDVHLPPLPVRLNEVLITPDHDDQIQTSGVHQLGASSIKSMPALGGEADLIKSIQFLPGVKTLGVGTSGYFVRGGNIDQNLILLDEAPVYNPAHLLGFLSTFNTDVIKHVTFYSGAIPAAYGGRLSSLIDVRTRDGNEKHWTAMGGVGLVSARFTAEGPIVENKSSLLVSGRRTYADLLIPLIPDDDLNDTNIGFYDLHLKYNYRISPRDRIYLSGFIGADHFNERAEFDIHWGNQTATLRWNHIFTDKIFSNLSLIGSRYYYNVGIVETSQTTKWTSSIKDLNFKADFTFFPTTGHTVDFGLHLIHHWFRPGEHSTQEISQSISIPKKNALESAVYISDDFRISTKVSGVIGVRYSTFSNIGPSREHRFDVSHQYTRTDEYYGRRLYHNYSGIEPRSNLKYSFSERTSITLGFSSMYQYLQLISNGTTSLTAPEIWLPAGPNIKPQRSDQWSVGFRQSVQQKHNFDFSLEAFYKKLLNQIDYADHAELTLNQYVESELRRGRGKAYGLEFMATKTSGKLTGFLNYTWCRSYRQFSEINGGKRFPARFDRPHAVNVVATLELSQRWRAGANWVFTSGEAVTLPMGAFVYDDRHVPVYGDRNSNRYPHYHRLDLSATRENNKTRRWRTSWTFSLYNAYFRKNTFALNYDRYVDVFGNVIDSPPPGNGALMGVHKATTKTYLFSVVPSVTFNFQFE